MSRRGTRPGPPTAAEAATTLRDLAAIGSRSGRVAYAQVTRQPLLAWGLAWLIGYLALGLLPWRFAVPAGYVLAAGAIAVTVLSRSPEVVSGAERRLQLCWAVLMGASPFLIAIVAPEPATNLALLLGALWGVALVLYATVTGDLPLGLVGALVVVAAAAAHVTAADHQLVVFAVVAGGAMAVLGLVRTIGGRR